MNRLARKLRYLLRRGQLDRDLEEELRFHVDMKAEELGDRAEAERRIGNQTAIREAAREAWTFAALESCWSDLRYAARAFARTPGFAAAAIVTLGLGIGADTAVFTIVHGAFSWDMGLDHPERMMILNLTDPSRRQDFGISYPDFRDLRAQAKSFAGMGAYQFAPVNLSDNRTLPERTYCVHMTANGFAVSGQSPVLGRGFLPEDERPGAPAAVILSYGTWEDRYGKDPAIPGKHIRVNDVPAEVIGVMPPGKRFPEETDIWMPLIPDAGLEQRANRSVAVFASLAPDASVAAARSELNTIAARLAAQYPKTNRGLRASLMPIAQITGAYNMRPLFAALWTAIGFVLLIACANVANMLLARGAARRREISIRVAIGAGRGRIVRQLLMESLLLAAAGGLLGWMVAIGGLRWFDAGTGAIAKPVWLRLALDTTAFSYLAAISLGAGVLFGLAPAARLSKVDVHAALKDGGQGIAGGRRVLSLSNLMVTAEMALCVVLLAGAGLTIRSALNLSGAAIGVSTANVLTMHVNLPQAKYPRPADETEFHRELKARLDSLPGVESTGLVSHLPFGGSLALACELEGTTSDPGHLPRVGAITATAGYFSVMQVSPRRGRLLTESDRASGIPVVAVNETFAEKFWPGEDALGKRLRLADGGPEQPWLTVIGVVPDILQNFRHPLDHDPLVYLAYNQLPRREMFLVSKTRVPPGTLADDFRRAVQGIDANLAVYDVRTLENRLAQTRLTSRLVGSMFAVFAAVALLLAATGLYAVMAHAIRQRTQEIGVRMALGGSRRDILRLVYAEGLRPVAMGMMLGLPMALAVTRVLRSTLMGVSAGDPVTFTLAVLALAAAAVLGCCFPARRALRVDPVVALRYE